MADPKEVHVDLLEIDMTTGNHWLDPVERNRDKFAAIVKQNRDKWLAAQRAKVEESKS